MDRSALKAGVCVGMNNPVTASIYHQFLDFGNVGDLNNNFGDKDALIGQVPQPTHAVVEPDYNLLGTMEGVMLTRIRQKWPRLWSSERMSNFDDNGTIESGE